MQAYVVNIDSQSDCQMLMDRICGTLRVTNPQVLAKIQQRPGPLCQNDTDIFERLCLAILSNGSGWKHIDKSRVAIRHVLQGYDIAKIATLSQNQMDDLCHNNMDPIGIPSRILMSTKLEWVRCSAIALRGIQQQHGSVSSFIRQEMESHGQESQESLRAIFTKSSSPSKLKGVGFAVCCEFFKQIGIDDFKPDVHTIRFLTRTGINGTGSKNPRVIWSIGVKMANTLGWHRTYVDSAIWSFCADGYGEICTEMDPKCHLCQLATGDPRLCVCASPGEHKGRTAPTCSFRASLT